MLIKEMKIKELKELTAELYSTIFVTDCFNKTDLILYEVAVKELEARGFEVQEQGKLSIKQA